MITEGRQGNIEDGNIINTEKFKDRYITIAKKFKKDVHDIDKNITEAIRDNEELNNTIEKIIERGIDDDDNIINMLNDMMVEGKKESSSSSTRIGLLRRPQVGLNQRP